MAIAAATRAITFRDDHQINNNSRRRCYHTSIIRGGSPTRLSTAALLLRAANESARLFLSQSPFSTSSVSSGGGHSSSKQFFKTNDKIESYFSAIGGHSDLPPPSLTSNQVTRILRTNESLIFNNVTARENEVFINAFLDREVPESKTKKSQQKSSSTRSQEPQRYSLISNSWVTSIESNQLASNHPIEDRLRVATLNLEKIFSNDSSETEQLKDDCMAFGVFDGHSGGLCADLISRRLFHYIAIALRALELRSSGAASSVKPAFSVDILQKIARDHTKSPPDFYHNIHVVYEESIAERLQARIEEFEWRSLEAFAIEELDYEDLPTTDDVDGSAKIESALRRAFLACDRDLSREIQANLLNTSSNVLLHYYLSLAISGSCATVVILYKNEAFIASAGDTKAVMGTLKQAELKAEVPESDSKVKPITRKILKSTELSFEHNSENIKELNRLMSEHPKDEQNYIIRENRLLGSLMPLRAFGDFSFKWSVEKMKQLGITRAFGSHIISTHYKTPPYLTAEPEITKLSLVEDADECAGEEDTIQLDRFIILATDGLWEQFEGARKVVQAVNRYRQNVQQQIDAFTSANLFKFDDSKDGDSKDLEEDSDNDDSPLTIGKIVDRLRKKVTDPPAAIFERITADDDLIEDINCGTYLLRTALSDTSAGGLTSDGELAYEEEEKEKFSHHEDQYEQQRKRHDKLVGFLTLPQSVVRNFRDDISLIVIGLK